MSKSTPKPRKNSLLPTQGSINCWILGSPCRGSGDEERKWEEIGGKFHLHQINKAEKLGDEGVWQVKLGDGTLISCYMVWVQGQVNSDITIE